METIRVRITRYMNGGKSAVYKFIKDEDGWHICKKSNLAIDPEKKCCMTEPWYADHICDAPEHQFKILN